MPKDQISNEELARLLLKFAQTNGGKHELKTAQTEFFNHLNNKLEKHALRYVNNNREIAQTALQEAWISIFRSAHTYDPALAKVETWAKRITFNCAMNELRTYYKHHKPASSSALEEISIISDNGDASKTEEHQVFEFSSDAYGDIEDTSEHTDSLMYAQQLKAAVADCIKMLPSDKGPNYQLAMTLCLDEDLSYSEITNLVAAASPRHSGVNTEQVRGWIRQAKEKMQNCLRKKLGWQNKGSAA